MADQTLARPTTRRSGGGRKNKPTRFALACRKMRANIILHNRKKGASFVMKNNFIIMAGVTLFAVVVVLGCVIVGPCFSVKIQRRQLPASEDLLRLRRMMF